VVVELSKVPGPSAEADFFIDEAPIEATGGVAVRTDAYKALLSPFLIRV
jgi:hypothetical protein